MKWLKNHPLLTAGVLVLVTFSVYARALANAFVYDDEQQILQNPFVLNPHLWSRIFTGGVWSFQGVAARGNFYRPLQIFSYWLVYRLAGPEPAVFHLVHLLLYSSTVWLVYRLGCHLLQTELAAFAGALLWAVHPLHVEAVAWIAGWPEAGFGFFYLLGFLLFLRAERATQGQALRHSLAALAYFPALFFKEMAVSFPLMVLAYWFFRPAKESWLNRGARFVPYLVTSGTYVAIRRLVLGHLTHLVHLWKISPSVLTASVGLLGEHTKMFFWPARLTVFRNFELGASVRSPWPWLTLLALVAALGIRKREPLLSFLVFWWPVTLLPCLDARQLSIPLVADRFSYIPSVGLCLAISFMTLVVLPKWMPSARLTRLERPCLAGVTVVAFLWTVQTTRAIPRWRDNQTLLNYSLVQSPEAAHLHIVEAWALEYRFHDLDGAAREFETALRLNRAGLRPLASVTYDTYIGLGQVAYRKGRTGSAMSYFDKAVRLLPSFSEAYKVLGSVYFPQQDYARAAEYFAQAVNLNPLDPGARFYLGTCWIRLVRYREAAEQFRAATAVDPTYWQAYEAEARALEAAGDAEGAARVRSLERQNR